MLPAVAAAVMLRSISVVDRWEIQQRNIYTIEIRCGEANITGLGNIAAEFAFLQKRTASVMTGVPHLPYCTDAVGLPSTRYNPGLYNPDSPVAMPRWTLGTSHNPLRHCPLTYWLRYRRTIAFHYVENTKTLSIFRACSLCCWAICNARFCKSVWFILNTIYLRVELENCWNYENQFSVGKTDWRNDFFFFWVNQRTGNVRTGFTGRENLWIFICLHVTWNRNE